MMSERDKQLAGQFILDDQTHFLRDDFAHEAILGLGEFAAEHWNPKLKEEGLSLARYKFENYIRELWYTSDTKMALLSGAPFDDPTWWLLSNEQITAARDLINDFAGAQRMLFTPSHGSPTRLVTRCRRRSTRGAWTMKRSCTPSTRSR